MQAFFTSLSMNYLCRAKQFSEWILVKIALKCTCMHLEWHYQSCCFAALRLRRELRESVQSQMEAMPPESLAPTVGDGGEEQLLENLQHQLQSSMEVSNISWDVPLTFSRR